MHATHTRLVVRLLAVLVLAGGGLVVLGDTGRAEEQEASCDNPDIDSPGPGGIFMGTDDDDVIAGTAGNDLIQGNGGHDYICGNGGSDVISAGEGDDTVWGADGNDLIDGGPGDDYIHAGPGKDLINGGDDDDACFEVEPTELVNCDEISEANGEAD